MIDDDDIAAEAEADVAPSADADPAAILYPDDAPASEAETPPAGDPAAPPTDYQLTAPEGFDLSPQMLEEAAPVFRELGLDSEGANRLMPLAGKLADHIVTGLESDHSTLKKDWAKATLADPHIGGANWNETRRLVDTAMKYVGAGPQSELRELLNESGLGNHPAFVRAFRQFGAVLARKPGDPAPKQDRLSTLYPND